MGKMKNSRIEWIGNIPEEWEIKKIKYITKIPITDGPHETPVFVDEGVPFYSVDGIQNEKIVYEPCRYISVEDANRFDKKIIPSYGDILMGKAASIGKIAIIDKHIRMQVWSPLAIIRVNENIMNNVFLKYYLLSNSAQIEIDVKSTSNTQKNIAMEDIENITIPFFDIKEQKLIADFLDDKVEKIDNILYDLNKQIEILEKFKKSMIIEKVTKGLKETELKETNVTWMKNIPKAWKIRKIKHAFINDKYGIKVGPFGSSLTDCVVDSTKGEYKIYGQANLIRKDFEYGDNFVNYTNFKRLSNYEVIPGDIAVSMMGTIGKCCVVPQGIKQGIMDSHLIKIRLNNNIMNSKYFEYQYEGLNIYEQLLYNSNGSIMNGLNSTIVKNVYFIYPPLEEQEEIVKYLDKKCTQIDEIIKDKQVQIEKMQKYKKSLIYEYVTGKKRVKGAE